MQGDVNWNNVLSELVSVQSLAVIGLAGVAGSVIAYLFPEYIPTFEAHTHEASLNIPSLSPSKVDIGSLKNKTSISSEDKVMSTTSTSTLGKVAPNKWIGKNFNGTSGIKFGGRIAMLEENGINFFNVVTNKYRNNIGMIGQMVELPKGKEVEDVSFDFEYRVESSWDKAMPDVVIAVVPKSAWMKDEMDILKHAIFVGKLPPVANDNSWHRFTYYDNYNIPWRVNKMMKLTGGKDPLIFAVGVVKSALESSDDVDIKNYEFLVRFKENKEEQKEQTAPVEENDDMFSSAVQEAFGLKFMGSDEPSLLGSMSGNALNNNEYQIGGGISPFW